MSPVDFERRFGGLDRLYGEGFHLAMLKQAHAMVVGVGGVGSWVAEALARSGVGHITLVDMDHVAESNINRQVQANSETLGKAKVLALKERIALISPECRVNDLDVFLEPSNAQALLEKLKASGAHYLAVLDCCDQTAAKVAMAVTARALRIPIVMAGSAGGKTQPWLLEVADLRDSTQDPLLAKVRYQLRKQHRFANDAAKKLGVQVVFSPEQVMRASTCDPSAGLNCAGYGSVVTVTASMGLAMVGAVINQWAKAFKSASKAGSSH